MPSRVEVLQTQIPAYNRLRTPYEAELIATAKKMTAPGKGLLAVDETFEQCEAMFKPFGLSNTSDHRRQLRSVVLECEGMEQYTSGVILHDETIYQKCSTGETFARLLTRKGVVAGVKTDMGLHPLIEGAEGEQMTEGLDGYGTRAKKYYDMGCRFCKWRNVYKIQNGTVSEAAVRFNAETQARYAILSQKHGLVPILEPEVMLEGNHDIESCQRVSQHVWAVMVSALHRHGVIWEGCVMKASMVVPGGDSGIKVSPEEVARYTVMTLSRVIPAALPGVMFLSGGLSDYQSAEYLNAMNCCLLPRPWRLSFSYGRALTAAAYKTWAGNQSNVAAARRVYMHRSRMNSLAQLGKYCCAEDK